MTKKELAFRYAPDLSYSGAISRLRRWINGDQQLLKALEEAHYDKRKHVLTEQQVRIIEEYLS